MGVERADLSEGELRLGEIAFACLKAREAGQPLDRQDVLARHPEFAAELAEFLARLEDVDRVAAPLREAVRPTATLPRARDAPLGPGQPSLPPRETPSFGDY